MRIMLPEFAIVNFPEDEFAAFISLGCRKFLALIPAQHFTADGRRNDTAIGRKQLKSVVFDRIVAG